jgi:hypothetical protein
MGADEARRVTERAPQQRPDGTRRGVSGEIAGEEVDRKEARRLCLAPVPDTDERRDDRQLDETSPLHIVAVEERSIDENDSRPPRVQLAGSWQETESTHLERIGVVA